MMAKWKIFYLLVLFCVPACQGGALSTTQPGTEDMDGVDAATWPDASHADATTFADTNIETRPDATMTDTSTDAAADVEIAPPADPFLYVAETDGTITVYAVDEESGTLTRTEAINQPGGMRFLAFSPDQKFVYAASDDRVQAFAIDAQTALPAYLGDASSAGRGTHLEVDHSGQYVFVASYGDHLLSMLPLQPDGTPSDATVVLGGADDPGFCQNAHQVRVHRSNRFVYVPCLGSDHIAVLHFDADTGSLVPQAPAPTQAGAGPRHMDFHPTLDVAYVINERDSTVNVYGIDTTSGALTELQSITTIAADRTGPSASSDIHVSPDGQHVYGVNRDPLHDIAVFDVENDGTLAPSSHASTGGEHSRSFTIDRAGRYLYLGNANSMDLVSFEIGGDGSLTQTAIDERFDARIFFVGLSYQPR